VLVLSQTALSAFAAWALWHVDDDPTGRLVAAIVPFVFWGTFFIAALLPGAGVDNDDHPVPRPLGIPVNLLVAGLTSALAASGYAVDRALNP
jgi:hypothetical protein